MARWQEPIAFILASLLAWELVASETFIVRMDNDIKPSVFPSNEHWYMSKLLSVKAKEDINSYKHAEHEFIHVYKKVFHGFCASLTAEQARQLGKEHGVLAVFPDKLTPMHTTRSPEFLGLRPDVGLWPASKYGSDTVVGVLDTGIWPERGSFSDHGMGPVPKHWKGECEEGEWFSKSMCNNKLVGARYLYKGYESFAEINKTAEIRSARDTLGHGTHTSSTAVGGEMGKASLFGYAEGTAIGMAPRARLAVYKICWLLTCANSDILAGFDKAVEDGVDVINLSVGGTAEDYANDTIAIGAFGAMAKGVFVSTSAGNSGPFAYTVSNVAPWITTVGAGSMDRSFPAQVKLHNGEIITGVSLSRAKSTTAHLVYAGDRNVGYGRIGKNMAASRCGEGALDPKVVTGKIVVCYRGNGSRLAKGVNVLKAGGVGMVLLNRGVDGVTPENEPHVLPTVAVGSHQGEAIRKHLLTSKNPAATLSILGTVVGHMNSPKVAAFSSRGPNVVTPGILKPDLIAPGVSILAAWSGYVGPSGLPSDKRRTSFSILSGTSMSCPHVTGIAALLKSVRPEWSQAAIKSALMTTSYTRNNMHGNLLDDFSDTVADPFAFGAGHVHPQRALDPGLVYDLSPDDYMDFLCGIGYSKKFIKIVTHKEHQCPRRKKINAFNYPSFSAVFHVPATHRPSTTFFRVVTNVGPANSTYKVDVIAPKKFFTVKVRPEILVFTKRGQKLGFKVTVRAKVVGLVDKEDRSFGFLAWSDGKHFVKSPIVVIRRMKK